MGGRHGTRARPARSGLYRGYVGHTHGMAEVHSPSSPSCLGARKRLPTWRAIPRRIPWLIDGHVTALDFGLNSLMVRI
eukprot:3538993-Prymnesium_polylepis.1